MKCKSCGKPVADNAMFCTNCGTVVKGHGERQPQPALTTGVSAAPSGASEVVSDSGETALKIALVVLSAIAVAAIAVVLIFALAPKSVSSSKSLESMNDTYEAYTQKLEEGRDATEQEVSESTSSESGSIGGLSDTIKPGPRPLGGGSSGLVWSDSNGSSSSSSSQSEDKPADEPKKEEEPSSSSSGSDEAALKAELQRFLDRADSYDRRVMDCADDFNNNYFSSSRSTRESLARISFALEDDIDQDAYLVYELEPSESSEYYDEWMGILELYICLWCRIDVINQAWSISLQYDDPAGHEDEILAPIYADRGADGDNIYYTRYKELRPTIHL